MGSAIGKHRTSSSCSLAMRIPFSWGSKGDILFPWKENIPLNRPPARCRENPALSGDFDSLCHIGTKINRPLWRRIRAAPTALPPPRHKCREALRTGAKPIVPFIYKRQPSCFSTCCGRVLKVNGTVTNIRNFLLYLGSNTIQRGMLLWLKNSLKQNRSVCSI